VLENNLKKPVVISQNLLFLSFKITIMRIISTISLLICLTSNAVFSQMYVGANSYVFNKGSMVYIKDYLELNAASSNFYLRNEGQLLQGSTTLGGLNRGVGSLSVYQEGTSNNFGYNYWCSPVGVAAASAGNNNFALNSVINRPTSVLNSSLPSYTSGYNGFSSNSTLLISTAWIYQYQSSVGYGYGATGWNFKGETGTIIPGLGFTMKGVAGDDTTDVGEATLNNPSGAGGLNDKQRYDFRGKPNDGNILIPVGASAGLNLNTTLTGNPYPSAINLNYFLLENSGYTVNYATGAVSGSASGPINGIAYFWEHQKPATTHTIAGYIGGYGQYVPNNSNANSPGTYNNAPFNTYNIDGSVNVQDPAPIGVERYKRMFSPIGQGFFVVGTQNGTAVMKNQYRVHVKEGASNNSEFERTSSAASSLEIGNWDPIANVAGVDYTQFSKELVPQIKIHTVVNNQVTKEVTIAFNPNTSDGYDTAMDAASFDTADVNDSYLSIAGNTNQFVITTLPFDITKRVPFTLKSGGTTSFKITVGNIINFYGSDTIYLYDGLTGIYHDIKNGSFEIALPEGTYANRFEVTFVNTALSTDTVVKDNFLIVQNNDNQTLTVNNPNGLDIKSADLFDITGKLIFKKVDLGVNSSYEFSTSGLSDGVYIAKITSIDGKSKAQKVIIERSK
jgi:hypothetical protein